MALLEGCKPQGPGKLSLDRDKHGENVLLFPSPGLFLILTTSICPGLGASKGQEQPRAPMPVMLRRLS